ncbi:MAG: hypothetical protein ICV72_14970, partial [Aldersonia sp.]|nr:hypothetical protein [Aldersonia sp.]
MHHVVAISTNPEFLTRVTDAVNALGTPCESDQPQPLADILSRVREYIGELRVRTTCATRFP